MPRYSANISILFPELPFIERFAAARLAGFEAVECWHPYSVPVEVLRQVLADQGLVMVGINSSAGVVANGDWGLAASPGRVADFQASIREALHYANGLGASCIHVMAGIVATGTSESAALATYRSNLEWALRQAEDSECCLVIEPLNHRDRPGYLLSRSDQAAEIITSIAHAKLKMMFDIYHVQISEGDILKRLERHLPLIGHIQIAAVPSRAEPDEGELDYRVILAAIDRLGWSGWVGAEYRPRAATLAGLGWREALAPA